MCCTYKVVFAKKKKLIFTKKRNFTLRHRDETHFNLRGEQTAAAGMFDFYIVRK